MMNAFKSAGLPEPEFSEIMGGFVTCFKKAVTTEEKVEEIELNERQIKAVEYIKEHGHITNKEYQDITGVSRQMTTRELSELVNKNVLKKVGTVGKGTKYVLSS